MLLSQIEKMQAPRVVVAPALETVWSGALDAQRARDEQAGVPPERWATGIRLTGHSPINYYGPDSITHAMSRASMNGADAQGWR